MSDYQNLTEQLLDSGSAPLPSESVIIEGYVKALHQQAIDEAENIQEAKDFYIDYYTNGPGAAGIKSMISDFKNKYAELKNGIDDLKVSITQITASNAMPSVITTGAAASVPNPSHFMIENAQKKRSVQVQVRALAGVAAKVLEASDMLCMGVPSAILTLIYTLITVKKTVESIPG